MSYLPIDEHGNVLFAIAWRKNVWNDSLRKWDIEHGITHTHAPTAHRAKVSFVDATKHIQGLEIIAIAPPIGYTVADNQGKIVLV